MCALLSESDSAYIGRVSARIVRMFQRYVQNIDAEDERFHAFICKYLAERDVKDLKAVPYAQLYKLIKEAIREYLSLEESRSRSKK